MAGNSFSNPMERSQKKHRSEQAFHIKRRVLLLLPVFAVMLLPGDRQPSSLSAYQIIVKSEGNASEDGNRPKDKDFPGAAPLKPRRDLVQTLKQAESYAADGKYESAIILWQRVLDASQDEIVAKNEGLSRTSSHLYRSYEVISRRVERMFAELPPEALREYRLTVDGDAKALFTQGMQKRDEKMLGSVVRRYFLSSWGDDAAFHLASIRFDRGDFVGAGRLLTRILQDYPNPDLKRGKLLYRLALVNTKLGDVPAAQKALKEVSNRFASDVSREAVSIAEQSIKRITQSAGTFPGTSESWRMELGGPARDRHMPSLPEPIVAGETSELWADRFDISLVRATSAYTVDGLGARRQLVFNGRIVVNGGRVIEVNGSQRTARTGTSKSTYTPTQMINLWKSNGWLPCSRLLFDNGLVYYKNKNRLVCRDSETGELCWMGRRNSFELDSTSQLYQTLGANPAQNGRPTSISEVQLFGDRVAQAMSIADGTIYSLEGPLAEMERGSDNAVDSLEVRRAAIRKFYTPVRERRNWLSAYESDTGKLKWYRDAEEKPREGSEKLGFLAAPVPCGDLLLVPVSDSGELWLYALNSKDGATLWKSYLCEDPPGGSSPWIPVGVSVEGADAYVASGTGLVFALDAESGSVHWAVRYRRSGTPSSQINSRARSANTILKLDGWDTEMAIPHGNLLIVFASDFDHLLVLDRRDGTLLWESPRTPHKQPEATYCLGILNDGLFVAGRNVVRRYSLAGGRIDWEARIGGSFGRGALTADAIYMPEGDSVVQLDPATGERLSRTVLFSVKSAVEPVGNLYSDGNRLLVIGMGRVAALADLKSIMKTLESRIEQGDGNAQLTRMRLQSRLGNDEDAINDLIEGFRKLRKQELHEHSLEILHDALGELNLSETRPRLVLELMAESGEIRGSEFPAADESSDLPKDLLAERTQILKAAIVEAQKKKVKGAVSAILRVIPLSSDQYLLRTAQEAIAALAEEQNANIIYQALQSENGRVRVAAVPGIPGAFGERAGAQYERLLVDSDDHVRLAASQAMANQGSRSVLPVMADLLESENLDIRAKASQSLQALTGQRFHYTSYDSPESRAAAVQAWKSWIDSEGQTAELKFPIDPMSMMMGRTLLCDQTKNRVIELNKNGTLVWEKNIVSPYSCQGLPNGHRLVASYTERAVIEFDADGEECWRIENLPSSPYSVQRLPNGNTLVACYRSKKILEYKPDKSVAWSRLLPESPRDARRLSNGNTLVTFYTSGQVIEIDQKGRTVWKFTNIQRPYSSQRLENGNTLISLFYAGEVIEVDREGNIVWSKKGLKRCYDAQRLPNGHTIISSLAGVQELDLKGEVIWERKGPQLRKVSRY